MTPELLQQNSFEMSLKTLVVALGAIFLAVYLGSSQCPSLDAIKGKVVIVTGSSSGIGAELAQQYGKLGARLVLAARRKDQLEVTAEAARAAGAESVLVVP